MDEPVVSILVPTKNRGALLSHTLESVRAQTFGDFECVVIDDGSTDDTLSRLAAIETEDARFRHVTVPAGRSGAQAGRNVGIAAARGRYVVLLDSDDLLAPHCLAQRVAFLDARADLDFCVSPCEQFRKMPGDTRVLWNIPTDENALDRFLKWDVAWQTTSPLWRTEAVRRVGPWDEAVPVAQDWLFHLTALVKGLTFEWHGTVDHYWRMAESERDSIGRRAVEPQMVRARAGVIAKTLPLLKDAGLLTDARKRHLAGLWFIEAERLAAKVSRKEARQHWTAAGAAGLLSPAMRRDGSRYFFAFKYPGVRNRLRRRIDRTWPADVPLRKSRTSGTCPSHDVDGPRYDPKPTVSCVMACYNNAPFLERTLDSVLGQTLCDFELIVVNDSATDNSLAILNDYKQRDARVKVITQPNAGQAAGANTGLAVARGEFIARLDGDDVCLPTRFEKQVAFLRANPDVVCVGSNVELVDPYDVPLGAIELPTEHEKIDAMLIGGSGGAIVQPVAMIRRAALEQAGPYDARYTGSEDLDMSLRLGEIGRLANLPETLLHYRRHSQSFSLSKNELQMQHKSKILAGAYARRGMEVPAAWDFSNIWRPRPPAEQTKIWGWLALKVGRRDAAIGHAKSLLKLKPFAPDSWRLAFCAWRGR